MSGTREGERERESEEREHTCARFAARVQGRGCGCARPPRTGTVGCTNPALGDDVWCTDAVPLPQKVTHRSPCGFAHVCGLAQLAVVWLGEHPGVRGYVAAWVFHHRSWLGAHPDTSSGPKTWWGAEKGPCRVVSPPVTPLGPAI